MNITLNENIEVSASKLVSSMTVHEIIEFCGLVSEKLDKEFTERNTAAENISDHLTENTCRFLAEVVTHFYLRNKETGLDTQHK